MSYISHSRTQTRLNALSLLTCSGSCSQIPWMPHKPQLHSQKEGEKRTTTKITTDFLVNGTHLWCQKTLPCCCELLSLFIFTAHCLSYEALYLFNRVFPPNSTKVSLIQTLKLFLLETALRPVGCKHSLLSHKHRFKGLLIAQLQYGLNLDFYQNVWCSDVLLKRMLRIKGLDSGTESTVDAEDSLSYSR